MAQRIWTRIDRLMRVLHLYTGLFLMPWMAVYALSAFCLNHGKWVNETLSVSPPKFEVLREIEFKPDSDFPKTRPEQAVAILQHLELDGPHRVLAQPSSPMTIFRPSAAG